MLKAVAPDVFVHTDTCNAYVVRDGEHALLIDFGDGGVMEHLASIGVKHVEWVLFTHHHREQLQGWHRSKPAGAKTAGPEAERALFENPADFRRATVNLSDPMTVHGSSYVRPPSRPIPLDRTFKAMDDFTWRGREFWCLDTRGNSPGGMSYLLKTDRGWLAFAGDAMLAGAKLHNWFDSDWDYGFGAGVYALHAAASVLERFDPTLLLPSHGLPVAQPAAQLRSLQDKLRKLTPVYLRGYEINTFANAAQDRVSTPTDVPHVWRVTKHLYKFKATSFWPNFTILIADSGRGLVVDCGLFDTGFLDTAIGRMRDRLGLKGIDALFVTHAHGDHFLEGEHLRKQWGAKLWTMAGVHDHCERPDRYDFCAPIQAYGSSIKRGITGVKFDRLIEPGGTFEWEGYRFAVDWMPGQTKFACCLHGEIDGRRVAFTGDNLFGDPADPRQNGHEAVCSRNVCSLEEGYLHAADYLHSIAPDLIIGGHSWAIDKPGPLIERYRETAVALRSALRDLIPEDDYRYGFDPFWVRVEPYRVPVKPGGESKCELVLRNFADREEKYRVELHTPPGLTTTPDVVEAAIPAGATRRFAVTLKAAAGVGEGVQIVPLDVMRGGKRYGEWFDFIAVVAQGK